MSRSNPNEITREQGTSIPGSLSAHIDHPEAIGRYQIEKVLGHGGFGLVYLARDERLDRLVAVKVAHADRVRNPQDAQDYLDEARTVANLDHPNIVPVHDVGSNKEFPCYVVSKYIEGVNLATRLKQSRLNYWESAKLVATIADALHYAHKKGLVHRDVKPGNILIGSDGIPHVVDFGLALREENIGKGPRSAGTPAYMSPEQARSEGHRVDGRSDIFSLGVVFYQMLSGRRPFRGDTQNELLEQVTTYEPRPLRQYDEKLPKELARICYKAMSKRASERYSSAHDLADDLRHFLSDQTFIESGNHDAGESTNETAIMDSNSTASNGGPTPTQPTAHSSASIGLVSLNKPPVKIIPKGLRSFDSHDTDFFLELLPGPRDRDGLPDRLRFWKRGIEESDSDNTFEVGLIYGPSGCGKSSFVKAGLLPRLSDNVIPVYVEATPEETESRLLRGIRKRCPLLDDKLDLKQTMAALRRGQGVPPGDKILIVLDQFEQWLHAKKDESNTELVQALRQCDGGRVQCILMVRDDFWLSVSRFLHDLEIRLVEGHNVALADLFDLDHAKRVLGAFGRAFGRLPENVAETTKEQKEFLKQSVAGLAEEGKVICVRLALYAEMMKSKPWTMATFKEAGGTAGVGVTFLEETFSSTASPEHRFHQKGARSVLQNLLPETGLNIKGYMRSYSELLEASDYSNRRDDFDDLIRILDSEIRLITPTDPDGMDPESDSASQAEPGKRYYQLAHDFLVPSLREWLTRKQKETKQGRAELRLADRSDSWNAKNENRLLPSWSENLNLRFLTDKKSWTPSQRKMMKRASRVHGIRTLIVGALVAVIAVGAWGIRNSTLNRQRDIEATRLVEGLLQADTSQVGNIILDLTDYRQFANDDLDKAFRLQSSTSNGKLHAALALQSIEEAASKFLKGRLLNVSASQFEHVRDLMEPHRHHDRQLCSHYWQIAMDDSIGAPAGVPSFRSQNSQQSFQAACVLASFDPENENWKNEEFRYFVANQLVHVLPSELLPWRNALRPVQQHLIKPLSEIYKDGSEGEQVRSFATDTLADYLTNDADRLFDLLASSNEQQYRLIFDKLKRHHPKRAVELSIVELAKSAAPDASEAEKEMLAKRQANTFIMLLSMDDGRRHLEILNPNSSQSAWPLLGFRHDPRVRSYIIHWYATRVGDTSILAEHFRKETDVTVKRALLLAIGEIKDNSKLSQNQLMLIKNLVFEVYRQSPDAGLHAAAEWVLRRWGCTDELSIGIDGLSKSETQRDLDPADDQGWYINGAGQTMVILDAGEFQMGSPESEPDHYGNERQHLRKIHRRFAISSKHITKSDYREFSKSNDLQYHSDKDTLQIYMQTEDSPMISINWYEAAAYCNWLSEQEGIPEDQWCFEPNEEGKYATGMKAKDDFLELSGYRLPTEAEWEFACRAGTTTSRYYGLSVELLGNYAWYGGNNETKTWPVGMKKPNDFGLFDMQGNCYDWCYDEFVYDPAGEENFADDNQATEPTADTDNRILRGGGFINPHANVRSASRYFSQPKNRRLTNSFRVVRTIATVD